MRTPKQRLEHLAQLQKELLVAKREAEELSLRVTQMLQSAAEEEARLAAEVVDPPNVGTRTRGAAKTRVSRKGSTRRSVGKSTR
jgi:hypothetical protein